VYRVTLASIGLAMTLALRQWFFNNHCKISLSKLSFWLFFILHFYSNKIFHFNQRLLKLVRHVIFAKISAITHGSFDVLGYMSAEILSTAAQLYTKKHLETLAIGE